MSDFHLTYKAAVTTVGGGVFISLPGDQYIELTPEKARRIAVALFTKAAEAEGLERPEVIVLKPSAEAKP